jgi:hypothetical protein
MEGSSDGLILRYYPGICLEELRTATEILSQGSQYWGRYSTWALPKHTSELLCLNQFAHQCRRTEFPIRMIISLLSLFWKNKKLKRSPCCLSEYSCVSICLCNQPPLFLRLMKLHWPTGHIYIYLPPPYLVFYAFGVVSKERKQLVLLRTSCKDYNCV